MECDKLGVREQSFEKIGGLVMAKSRWLRDVLSRGSHKLIKSMRLLLEKEEKDERDQLKEFQKQENAEKRR